LSQSCFNLQDILNGIVTHLNESDMQSQMFSCTVR